jgi:hypothetical protein
MTIDNAEADALNLGQCCVCEGPGATVIVMLEKIAPVEGHGWGCVVCRLPGNGAVAVACESCAAAPDFPATLRFACRGYSATEGRIPIAELSGEWKHDAAAHRAEDEDYYSEEDEYDPGDDCGRWDNGRLSKYCSLAGTEFCDFECPYRD